MCLLLWRNQISYLEIPLNFCYPCKEGRCTALQVSTYRDAGKYLALPTSRCTLFDGENISFDASLVIYINSSNILPIIMIDMIYETQNLLSL